MNRFARVLVAVLVVILVAGAAPGVVGAQPIDSDVRIVARLVADGRTEFGLQQRGGDGDWGERSLPARRFFPVGAQVGRWLSSSAVSITIPGGANADVELRIVARLVADGRTEFGLQQRGGDGDWGERSLPARRFFPVGAQVGRWLSSSPLTLTVAVPSDALEEFTLGDGPRSGETLVAVSAGRSCAVRLDGGVSCWGRNGHRDHLAAAGLDDVVTVTMGETLSSRVHACALHGDGRVSCWGPGRSGQLGQGDFLPQYLANPVLGLGDAVAIAAGESHTCAVHRDGGVSCWGSGELGRLGDGTSDPVASPRRVPGLADVVTISAGQNSTCAVHRDGGVSCWGWGAASRNWETPQRLGGLDSVVSVGVGRGRTCAVRTGGQVYCWSTVDGPEPAVVSGVAGAVAVTVGRESACALLADGGVTCWGASNHWGQLGDGTTQPRTAPARVASITDAVAVSMNWPTIEGAGTHTCAVHADGSVSCWGSNDVGQLGDGTQQSRLRPTPVELPARIRGGGVPTTENLLMRAWMDRVVREREAEFPWLRPAWDYIRERARFTPSRATHGVVRSDCLVEDGAYTCRALSMGVTSLEHLGLVVHELAHVYDLTTSLTHAEAWGAAQLYFAVTYPDCHETGGLGAGVELLADTLTHLVVPDALLVYYSVGDCPGLPPEPSAEAEEVLRAALAGEVPDWFTENFADSAAVWAAWRGAPSMSALANFAEAYGGLCTTGWLEGLYDPAGYPAAAANPFRDGGC